MNVLGFDIGGTKCAVILAKTDETQVEFIDRFEIPTKGPWQEVITILADKGEDMLEVHQLKDDPFKIGISCGGPLNSEKGWILSPPNLPGWDEVPITEILSRRFSKPAYLQNDADACALAEWKYGAGRGTKHMIFLTFGTGLGAGLILNGRLYTGASGMAGEVGHIRLSEEGPIGYGKNGSFEGYASGGGIAQIARRIAEESLRSGKKASFHHGSIMGIETKDVALAAERNEEDAIKVFQIAGEYFGKGLAVLIDILNPEMIVVGSIYVRAGKYLEKSMRSALIKEALPSSYDVCQIVSAELSERIGDYGAVMAALSKE
jgi:glucokinase